MASEGAPHAGSTDCRLQKSHFAKQFSGGPLEESAPAPTLIVSAVKKFVEFSKRFSLVLRETTPMNPAFCGNYPLTPALPRDHPERNTPSL